MVRPLSTLLSLACLCLTALPSHAVEARDGFIPDEAMAEVWQTLDPDRRQQLMMSVFGNPQATTLRPCAGDMAPVEGQPLPTALRAEGIELDPRHGGDVGCALAEQGFWLLTASPSGAGLQQLTFLAPPDRLLEVEIVGTPEAIAAVSAIRDGWTGDTLQLRPRPEDAAGIAGAMSRVEMRETPPDETIGALAALIGQGDFDLSFVGFGPAPDVGSEPGCAQTGACAVQPCAPVPPENTLMETQLYNARDKAQICETLVRWRTERHDIDAPDARIARRALILALQEVFPEANARQGSSRYVSEFSLSGTRMLIFDQIWPALLTVPRFSQTVREVEVTGCAAPAGDLRRCRLAVTMEMFSKAAMPGGPQRALLEALVFPSRNYQVGIEADFRRENARWVLQGRPEVVDRMLDWGDGTVLRGPTGYFLDGLR